MTAIRATCPDCGPVDLRPGDLELTLATATDHARYGFDCPACRVHVSKYADPDAIAALMGVGVVIHPALPAALTTADLTKFCQALTLNDDLADVAAEEAS